MNTTRPDTELILPGKDRAGDGFCVLGYICRAALAFFCALGFSLFTADALMYDSLPDGTLEPTKIIVITLAATIFFAVMGISKRCFLITGGVGIAALIFALWGKDHLAERAYYCVRSLASTFFHKLTEIGYGGMTGYYITTAEEASMRRLHTNTFLSLDTAFTVIMVVYAALFCACLLRRVHVIPLVAVGSAVCTMFLYYGMNSGNSGFALILAGICGIIALAGYDRIFSDRKTVAAASGLSERPRAHRTEITRARRQSSSMGGFMAFGTALIAAIILVIPSCIKHRMNDIPVIATPAAKLENYFISLVNGQSPDFGSLLFSGVSAVDRRSTAFERRTYTGAHVFTVSSDINLPVYLRNWVGTTYSGDTWISPSYEQIAAYKQRFSEDFSPERMTSDLLWAIDENLTGIKNGRTYTSHSDIGYVTARIDIRKFRPTANLIFFPSYSDQRLGLLEYGTKEPLGGDYANYSDGIFSSTSYVFLDEYSTVANLPLLRDPDFAQNLSSLTRAFYRQASDLLRIINEAGGVNATDEALAAVYEKYRVRIGHDTNDTNTYDIELDPNNLANRYVYEMDDHERHRLLTLITDINNYNDYIYETYLAGCENFEEFETLARSIIFSDMPTYQDMDAYRAQNLKVRKIIDYLSKNMTYTLSPKEPDPNRPYVNAAETFLFDTNEGYCVQFATSAVMLLRALGIPARYAEGYIADNFERTRGEDPVARYSSNVLDNNAHAWIEVYYDMYGWVVYEATTPYMSDMYDGYVPPTASTSTGTDTTIPDETEPVEKDTTEPVSTGGTTPQKPVKKSLPAGVVITAIVIAIIAVIIICLRARADCAGKRFRKLVTDSAGSPEAARELNTILYRLLKLCGLVPLAGEQTADFAARVDSILGNISPEKFSKVARAVEKIEFAPSHSAADTKLAADYCAFLRSYLLRADAIYTRLWRKYILAL